MMRRGGQAVPFSPLVSRWFAERFGSATPAQEAGWPAIAGGADTLIAAPTGSGKTLAAFLWSLDRLLAAAAADALADRTYVIYASPLKALGNGVHQTLQQPLAELRALAAAEGRELPALRVMVRTGDTPAHERQAMTRRPPHVLITTPESLYILLTADRSRRFLAGAETVIVDEIHAVAQDKRGAHLALSLDRLDAPSRVVAGARGRAPGRPPPAHRALGDAAAGRGGGPSARGRGAAVADHRRRRTPARARSLDLGPRRAARSDRHARAVGRAVRSDRDARRGAPHDHRLRQHP